jgi:NADH-quinone oxidoreductase subunit E
LEYKEIITRYTHLPGGIIEAYHDIVDQYGYLPKDAIIDAAALFEISAAEAYGIATFYSMFTLKTRGKNIIRVCHSAPCYIAGSTNLAETLKNELGIAMGG